MSLTQEKRKLIKRRGDCTEAIQEKLADRADIRETKQDKKKRDPKTEARERELKREIAELVREENDLTHRIKELRHRKEKIVAALKKVLAAIASSKPDFNGHPSNVNADVRAVIAKANSFGLYVTSTTDGSSHSSSSWHYTWNNADGKGGAVDLGGTVSAMENFQRWCYDNAEKFREVIGPNNGLMVKNGSRYSLPEGSSLENMHDNHDHIAPYPGALT